MSKIPKIISGILAAILIAVVLYVSLPPVWFWIGFEIFAALLVAVGCAGEWWLHHHPAGRRKVEKEEHHNLESRFIAAVVFGVFMELFSLGHAIPEAMKLEVAVASANERAGTATNMAAQAIEKAAKFDLARAVAERETELMRSNNLVLQKQLQPRIITMEEITNFIFLTQHFPKNEIKVFFVSGRNETANYARQVRDMLNQADFKEETNAPKFGINPITDQIAIRINPGDTNWPDIEIDKFSTNETTVAYAVYTNGFYLPVIVANNPDDIAGNFMYIFKQIRINSELHSGSDMNTNEIRFRIMDKAN
jgi:hypothetical protein